MKLSTLIKRLQEEYEQHGDILCYTNGEHGDQECERINHSQVEASQAFLNIDDDLIKSEIKAGEIESNETIVLHIGGY